MTDWNEVWSELQITRRRGYALENQEGQEGVSCVALPVLRAGSPILAISISAPTERMSRLRTTQLARIIREKVGPRLPVGLSLPSPGAEASARSDIRVAG
jgi:DNA-binding IclR family transcriptional regulator